MPAQAVGMDHQPGMVIPQPLHERQGFQAVGTVRGPEQVEMDTRLTIRALINPDGALILSGSDDGPCQYD